MTSAEGATLVYRMTVRYVYSLSRKPDKDEFTEVGILPHTNLESTDTRLKRSEAYSDRLSLQNDN